MTVSSTPSRLARARGLHLDTTARVPWLFALPALLLYLAFFLVPSLVGAGYAFTDWNGFSPATWVGLDNFREAFSQTEARAAFVHTLLLSAAYVVVVNLVGLGLAIGLHRTLKSRNLLRTLFFAPAAVSPLAVAYIWRFILQPDGPLNEALRSVGLGGLAQPWLGDPSWALWAVLLTMVWQFCGYHMVVYLAGLQTIQDELYEAAEIDGASKWRVFYDITRPQLLPAFTISITLSLIGSLKVFDQVIALTGGGPGYASETLATEVYKQAFVSSRFGFSAALALVLCVVMTVLASGQLRLMRARSN